MIIRVADYSPLDLSVQVTALTAAGDLLLDKAAYAADPNVGDGVYGGPAFTSGCFIWSRRGQCYYDGAAWQDGIAP